MLAFCRKALWATIGISLCALAMPAALAQQAAAPPQAKADNPDKPEYGERMTLQDLNPGATLEQMPDWLAFRNYACGSNGGPPLRKLTGWSDFKLCKPDANGLYEVYFEYDNEAEYILRAFDNPSATRYAGTTEQGFPIVASALFSEDGVLRGLRMVTDPRVGYIDDQFFDLTDLRSRNDFYLLGPFVGGQVGLDATKDCVKRPLGPGESEVGNQTYVKLDCETVHDGLRYILKTRYFRKPGQYARDPQTGAITKGQYESSTVFEEYQVGYGPPEPVNKPEATNGTEPVAAAGK
jgi:hypothetical protein